MSGVRPALVDLVLTKCTPGVAAYEATILDLAARGFLQISGGPDGLRVTVMGRPGAGLAGYEQQVLGDVVTRLADTGGAPFAALAGACGTDVDGTWIPFRGKLMADGRRLGICRKNLWARPAGILFLFLVSIAAAILAAVVPRLVWHVGLGAAVVIGVIAWFALAKLLEALGTDVLTAAGAALAAQWQRERTALAAAGPFPGGLDPASLERHAFAVAAAGPPPGTRERPAEIWSSFSGAWRQVTPEPSAGLGSGGPEPGLMFSLAGITLGLTIVAALITTGTAAPRWATVPVTLAFVAGAAVLAVLGLGTVSRRSAMPRTAAFDGQVIARWQERVHDSDGSGVLRCTAIDDGERAWIFTESHVYARVAVGDLVQVTFSPRTGQLQRVTVTARPRTERNGGPG